METVQAHGRRNALLHFFDRQIRIPGHEHNFDIRVLLPYLAAGFHAIDTRRHAYVEYHNVKRFAFVARCCHRLYGIGTLIAGHDFKSWLILEMLRGIEEFRSQRIQGAHLLSRLHAAESLAITFDYTLVIVRDEYLDNFLILDCVHDQPTCAAGSST